MEEISREPSDSAGNRWVYNTFNGLLAPFTIFVWASLILFATIAGPFGTLEAMSPLLRLVFWGLVVTASVVVGYGVRGVTTLLVAPDRTPRFDVLAVILMTLAFTPVLAVLSAIVTAYSGVEAPGLPRLALYVFVTSAVIFGVRRLAPGFEPSSHTRTAPRMAVPERIAEPRLLRRLPEDARGAVLRLSADGHYVEVLTTKGTQKLRLRLSDAIDEMEPVKGYCVHRSHWVPRDAMCKIVRENAHKSHAILINGERIPVSRKYLPELADAGLI